MPRYSEAEAREAVAASQSYSEALRLLGMRVAGGNYKLFRHWVDDVWRVSTTHFDPYANRSETHRQTPTPLQEVLVEHSSYPRARLKQRLLSNGLKQPRCELCGQGDRWRDRQLALILDHINGVPDDNRLENLRIVCPNCAATFDTHCGRRNAIPETIRSCAHCGDAFSPGNYQQRYCSKSCSVHAPKHGLIGRPRLHARKVARPPYEQLLAEIEASSWSAVGRKYGVSDNAVRKWVRFYEQQRQREREERERQAAERAEADNKAA